MLTAIHPKLPMRNKSVTRDFYLNKLNFNDIGAQDYPGYLMVKRDDIEIHFFEYVELDVLTNDGQVYIRSNAIDSFYHELQGNGVAIHPNGDLSNKPWGQREFSILDPDHNLITFGQRI